MFQLFSQHTAIWFVVSISNVDDRVILTIHIPVFYHLPEDSVYRSIRRSYDSLFPSISNLIEHGFCNCLCIHFSPFSGGQAAG